jgi:hypothetical protein
MPAYKRVGAEAAAGAMERKHEQHHCEEYVGPRPFGRVARCVDPKPEVEHEDDGKNANQSRSEPEDQRDREGELGEEDDWIEYLKMKFVARSR